jgi:23S rRNA pseudouridine1911/1915/1917 synthase
MQKEFIVPSGNKGERLDVFLSGRLPEYSRSQLQRLIENGFVLLNGEKAKKNVRLCGEDLVAVEEAQLPRSEHPLPVAQDIPLDILYEDDYLLAVNKPAGMVVHPGNGNRDRTMVNALMYRAGTLSGGSEKDRPGIVHRLDKDTSGLLLVAKTDAMHSSLARMFADRTIEKTYIGICAGGRPAQHDTIDMPLGRNRREPIKRSVQSDGKQAITEYWLLSHTSGISILKLRLHTGRMHQIRVHCLSRGFPVLCDPVYGGGRERLEKLPVLDRPFAFKVYKCFTRHALHARTVAFMHPVLKKNMTISAPFPRDFEEAFRVMEFEENLLFNPNLSGA